MYLWLLEYKKLFFRTGMLLLVLAVLAVNAGKICINGALDPKALESRIHWSESDIVEAERELSGKITEENMVRLLRYHEQTIASMNDVAEHSEEAAVYNLLYSLYAYMYDYHVSNAETLKQAEENVKFFNSVGNTYDAAVNKLYTSLYADRYISDYANSEDFAILFEYDFSTLLLFLLALIGSCSLFWKERQDGTDTLLQTSVYGKKRLALIKITAFFVWLLSVGVLLFWEDIIIHGILYHLQGWMNPVYAIESYQFCTFSGSILEYVIFTGTIRLLAVMEAGACFALITLLLKGNILPVSLNLLVFSGCLVLSEQFSEITLISFLNPVSAMKPRMYTKEFIIVSLLGNPVSGAVGAFAVTLTILTLLLILINFSWRCQIEYQIPFVRRKGERYVKK